MTDSSTEVLVVGGGPAGAVAAMRLMENGIRPLIVEQERFPRYHIGESMTGECGAILRGLGLEGRMVDAGHPVKHGVCVYGPKGGDWWLPVMQRTEDGELRDQTTWQVRRSVFDAMLLDEAVRRGAGLVSGRATAPILTGDGKGVHGAEVRTSQGDALRVCAEMTLDCSGQATFLAARKVTGPKYLGAYDKQIAIFSQVSDYHRDAGENRERQPGNTHIFYRKKYHWAWAIPIDDKVTSVGVVVPASYFREKGESRDEFLRRELRELNPELTRRIAEAQLLEPAHVIPNYSFQVRDFAGSGYICVGDSHRFVDPIFSFGLYVAVKEAGLAAATAAACIGERCGEAQNVLQAHMVNVERSIDILEDAIDMFWESPIAFSVMVQHRYRDPLIDVFAGRIYEGMPHRGRDEAIAAARRTLKRERSYGASDLYSVPIGSRYHPERAGLWDADLDSVPTTETWMRSSD